LKELEEGLKKEGKGRGGAGYGVVVEEKEGWLVGKGRPFYNALSPNGDREFGTGSTPGTPRKFQRRDSRTNQKIGLTFPSSWAYRATIYSRMEAKLGFTNQSGDRMSFMSDSIRCIRTTFARGNRQRRFANQLGRVGELYPQLHYLA
jgi:hypothetical protein